MPLTYKHLVWLMVGLSLSPLLAQRHATILDHRDRIRISRMDVLNSDARETNLSITPDGKFLYFMSLRGGQPWSHKFMVYREDSVYDGDIWYSAKIAGNWQEPHCMPYGVNSYEGEDEPNITPDGSTVYFQSWNTFWQDTGGPYYKTQRDGRRWGPKVGLGGGITEFFRYHTATDGMSISPDERTFIVAAGLEYNGNMDLYASQKRRGVWSVCKRLPISTAGDERSVFIAADGRTIYFASDGYAGFGGLDIYKVTLQADGTFGPVVNVGKPFNTAADDYGFILTADGNEAYFVRNGDIYFADLKEADERIKPGVAPVDHLLTGTIRDSANWRGVSASVLLLDARTKRLVRKLNTNAKGRFEVTLPNQNRIYDIVVQANEYHSKRGRVAVEEQGIGRTYTSNFILTPKVPPASAPASAPIAAADPPSRPTPTPPSSSPSSPPTRSEPPIRSLEQRPPSSLDAPPISQPEVEKVSVPEDPYSFDGIAENNLTLLLDVSASMRTPGRLPLLKEALGKMLGHMREVDQLSLVTYSGNVEVKLDGVSAARREEIMAAIDHLSSAGSTDGKGALRKAYNLAQDNFITGGNNRIILATDGAFDVEKLFQLAERIAADKMVLTVFSFGKIAKYRLDQLEELAKRGNGNHTNITDLNADEALLREAKAVRKGR